MYYKTDFSEAVLGRQRQGPDEFFSWQLFETSLMMVGVA